jgi:hypothetical protein
MKYKTTDVKAYGLYGRGELGCRLLGYDVI